MTKKQRLGSYTGAGPPSLGREKSPSSLWSVSSQSENKRTRQSNL